MKFFEGDLKNAISKRQMFCSAFIVFVENKDPESVRFGKALEEENCIPVKDYVAFRISQSSESYKHFSRIYVEVPVPSLFVIGTDGQPLAVLTSYESNDELYTAIKSALEVQKAQSTTQTLSSRLQNENSVQILLKLPGGETAVVEFPGNSRLEELKQFIRESLQVQGPFQMINPFPRKIFTPADESLSLLDLELSPTSTILVVPVDRNKPWTPQFVSNVTPSVYTTGARARKWVKCIFIYIGALFVHGLLAFHGKTVCLGFILNVD